jgi:hypothetical protein
MQIANDMKAKSVVLFFHGGSHPLCSHLNSTLALPSPERVVQAGSPEAGRRSRLVSWQREWRQAEKWETVSFVTLGVCGATTTAMAFLRMFAG